jgi:hypothetical protein
LDVGVNEVGWKCGEIDILEYVGREPDIIFTSLHTGQSWKYNQHKKNKD